MDIRNPDSQDNKAIDAYIAPALKARRKLMRFIAIVILTACWSITSGILFQFVLGGWVRYIPVALNMVIMSMLIVLAYRASEQFHTIYMRDGLRLLGDFWINKKQTTRMVVLVHAHVKFEEQPDLQEILKEFRNDIFVLRGPFSVDINNSTFYQTFYVLFRDPDVAMMFKLKWAT